MVGPVVLDHFHSLLVRRISSGLIGVPTKSTSSSSAIPEPMPVSTAIYVLTHARCPVGAVGVDHFSCYSPDDIESRDELSLVRWCRVRSRVSGFYRKPVPDVSSKLQKLRVVGQTGKQNRTEPRPPPWTTVELEICSACHCYHL